jgi:general L-amino acid transport system permease protein
MSTTTTDRPAAAGTWTRTVSWLRHNLFRSKLDAVVTPVSALIVGYVLYRAVSFVLVTGRWEIVEENLTLFLVGPYPRDELWRPAMAVIAVAGYGGLLAGVIHVRQAIAADTGVDDDDDTGDDGGANDDRSVRFVAQRVSDLLRRLWPLVVGVAVLLGLATTPGPWLVAAGTLGAAIVGRLIGGRLPRRSLGPVLAGGLIGSIGMIFMLTRPVGWDSWGGLMLNVFLAVISLALCFPLGVLLALGRRSKLPLVRWMSVVYIELFRGVPLYVLLLMAGIALGFFVPQSVTPGFVARAIVVFTLFTAAYVAEIVRGGLQSLPSGQAEAARALGLSPTRVTFFIVLPQALRNVIPALVGQFISLFKDTTLAGAALGLLELLSAAEAATSQPQYRGQQLYAETAVFVMFLFWVGSITMSRESQRLETKLGVGTR